MAHIETIFENFNSANTRETTNLLKKYLNNKYGIKFKITTKSYSGGSSMEVSYIGGPDKKIIKSEVDKLQYGNFDGMEDIYNYKDDSEVGFTIDDKILKTYKYVFVEQELSDKLILQLCKKLSDYYNFEKANPIDELDDIYIQFPEMIFDSWNWSQFLYQNFKIRNFITDNLDDIEILECKSTSFNGVYFTYRFENKTYSTDKYVLPTVIKTNKPIRTQEKDISVHIVDYTDKSIAVIGDTFAIKDKLKENGGKFNKFLTIDGKKQAGWIFPKTKKDIIQEII